MLGRYPLPQRALCALADAAANTRSVSSVPNSDEIRCMTALSEMRAARSDVLDAASAARVCLGQDFRCLPGHAISRRDRRARDLPLRLSLPTWIARRNSQELEAQQHGEI